MSQILDSTDERYITRDRSNAFCDRSTNVSNMVHIRFVRYTSVLIRQSPLVDSSLPVACPLHNTYALLLRFCAPYTFREDPHRRRDDFHHRINTG